MPDEAVLIDILKGDRMLRRGHDMREAMGGVWRHVCALPDYVWSRLGAIVGGGWSAGDVQHKYERRCDKDGRVAP